MGIVGNTVPLSRCVPWTPRPEIAPYLSGSVATVLRVETNGSPGCFGGWELHYPVKGDGQYLRFQVQVRWKDLRYGFESLSAEGSWTGANGWEPVIDYESSGNWVTLSAQVAVPSGASEFVVKLLLRWSPTGVVEWKAPQLIPVAVPQPRPIRLGASGMPQGSAPRSVQDNVQGLLGICRQAAEQGVQLLCLPEVALTYGLPKPTNPYEHTVSVPGPEIEPFRELAREAEMAICFSVFEREAEVIYNTAVLIDGDGSIAGTYRKVHLAPPPEMWDGVTPGDSYPVARIKRAQATVGMNICMDSSVEEAARCTARAGAEIILLPIMGDYRATLYWEPVSHVFDLRRWILIMQMRAMDNQVYLVVSRNNGIGTGIFSPDGTTLALNEGDEPIVAADVNLSELKRVWTAFKVKNRYVRRESTYGNLAGSLLPTIDENW